MYLNKRGGMQYGFIVGLLVVLASFFVIFLLIKYVFGVVGESDISCRTSIDAAARSKAFPKVGPGEIGVGRPLVKLDCPRGNLTIKKKDVVVDNRIDQDKAHRIIADEMLKCWKMVGAGKIDPFANWDNKKTSYCLICDSIEFDKDLEEFVGEAKDDEQRITERSIKGITNFLRTQAPEGSGKSYYDLMYKRSALKDIESENSIIDRGSLILVQMHKLKGKSSDILNLEIGLGGGAIVTGLGGAALAIAGVGLGVVTFGAAIPIAILGVSAAAVSSYNLVGVGIDAFSECKDCNGVGGIALVPYDKSLTDDVKLELKGGETYKVKLCDLLVN